MAHLKGSACTVADQIGVLQQAVENVRGSCPPQPTMVNIEKLQGSQCAGDWPTAMGLSQHRARLSLTCCHERDALLIQKGGGDTGYGPSIIPPWPTGSADVTSQCVAESPITRRPHQRPIVNTVQSPDRGSNSTTRKAPEQQPYTFTPQIIAVAVLSQISTTFATKYNDIFDIDPVSRCFTKLVYMIGVPADPIKKVDPYWEETWVTFGQFLAKGPRVQRQKNQLSKNTCLEEEPAARWTSLKSTNSAAQRSYYCPVPAL